ncbi:MAG: IPT/TIG domain-containing protein [Archangium sp.]|nr:IPT/TIG domain-containing protein [Archangium sp.]
MKRALTLLLVLSGCGAEFTPETLVDSLRIMGVSSDPPEVRPGESSTLSVLYGDPTRVGQPTTVIWVGCEPDPLDQNRNACNDASLLIKPSTITQYPEGLKLLGFSQKATYSASSGVFNVLPPDDLIRQNGSIGQVIVIVIAEEVSVNLMDEELKKVFERIENKELPTAIALTRIVVSEKTVESARNHNPEIRTLTFDGAALPIGARLQVKAGQKVSLGVEVTEASREHYVEQQPSGPVEKDEVVVGAWYSSGGRFSKERFDVTDTSPTIFTAPGSMEFPEDPVPERRSGQLWLVIRDNRGAQAYQQFRYYVCDESQPTPTVRMVTPPASMTDPVVVTGDNLARALDVTIGDYALVNGAFSSAQGGFVGFLPPELAPGTYPVRVRGQNCSATDTGLTYTVN